MGNEVAVRENAHPAEQSVGMMAGFEGTAVDSAMIPTHVGALSAVAREEAEIKAALVYARLNPRDEAASFTRLMKSCQRPLFAEKAQYAFPRGGSTVSGPSVNLARELARCWGNIRAGIRIVSVDDEMVHIKGYALDCETNNYQESEDKFKPLVQRKRGGKTVWVEPDERDLRELVNRRGALLERNAILKIMPPDVVEAARSASDETLRRAAEGDIEQGREDAVRRLALAFDRIGVSTSMLTGYLGHELGMISPDELADLRKVYRSLEDGHTTRADHFDMGSTPAANGQQAKEGTDRLRQYAEKKKGVAQQQEEQKPSGPTAAEILAAQRKKIVTYIAETPCAGGNAKEEARDAAHELAGVVFEDGEELDAVRAWIHHDDTGQKQLAELGRALESAAHALEGVQQPGLGLD